MEKIRLDVFLVNKKLARSRGVAQNLISNLKVLVNDKVCNKTNFMVNDNDIIEVIENEKYVSRGAYKLKAAIEKFKVNLIDLIAVDIGTSTGGFSQVLLENNVKKIYAIDVGTNQLNPLIKSNPKIINLEKTNFREIDDNLIKEKVDFITIDVSFISIEIIIKKIINLKWNNWKAIVLLKPQFELGKEISKTKGFVKLSEHKKIIDNFTSFLNTYEIKNFGYIVSPIKGAKKENIEYLFYLGYEYGK